MIPVNISDSSAKLAFIPDWSQSNPYQKLLYQEIEASGVTCFGMPGDDFTFAWIIKNKNNYKFIHLHWLHGINSARLKCSTWVNILIIILKVILARAAGYTVLWTVHNIVAHETSNIKLEIFTRKILARVVNHVIVHCEYARSEVLKLWGIDGRKVSAIPLGSYIGHYANDVSRSHAREKLNIGDHEFTFLFFGLLRNYKGVKELLFSYSELKKSKHDIQLIIAGDPIDEIIKKEIEDLSAGDGISLHLRYINDNDVQLFFNACDVVVLPFLNILTSSSAVLALSFGRPVIAPAKGCIPELLNETNGFLYRNQNELTAAMANAATCQYLPEMSINALERAKELQWDVIVADYYCPILEIKPK
jgi:beta-1,4-mannosyltransferase